MAHTSRSRTVSRASTPSLPKSSPSRFAIPPALRPTPSLSNLHIHSHNSPNLDAAPIATTAQDYVLDSSASSVVNMDMTEGILIQDMDAEVDTVYGEEMNATGQIDEISNEDGPKKILRDHLRKTLNERRPTQSGQIMHHHIS